MSKLEFLKRNVIKVGLVFISSEASATFPHFTRGKNRKSYSAAELNTGTQSLHTFVASLKLTNKCNQ